MTRGLSLAIAALSLPLALAACGETTGDRAGSGAAIGAASGAVIGALTPIGPLGGAAIGAAAGAATGALTDSSQVNLGKPAWRQGSSGNVRSASAETGDITLVRDIQDGLHRLGYDPGAVDGRLGPRTEEAIRHYQQDNGLAADGQPSAALGDQIHSRISGGGAGAPFPRGGVPMGKEEPMVMLNGGLISALSGAASFAIVYGLARPAGRHGAERRRRRGRQRA